MHATSHQLLYRYGRLLEQQPLIVWRVVSPGHCHELLADLRRR
jgi:hypothetical protein